MNDSVGIVVDHGVLNPEGKDSIPAGSYEAPRYFSKAFWPSERRGSRFVCTENSSANPPSC